MEDSEDRKEEVTDKIDLKADPVAIKSEDKNQEVANKNDPKAIEKELPAPGDITYKCHRCGAEFANEISHINHTKTIHDSENECHHCEAEFKDKTSLINHMKIIHNAENPTAIKFEDSNQEVVDKKELKAIKKELPDQEGITIKCHYCEIKFKDNTSYERRLKIHMLNVHNMFAVKSENPTAVRFEERNQ